MAQANVDHSSLNTRNERAPTNNGLVNTNQQVNTKTGNNTHLEAPTSLQQPPAMSSQNVDENNQWTDGNRRDRRSWRQRANILRGTSKCESDSVMLSADVHLVVYGVATHVTGLQLLQFLERYNF